MDSCTPLSSPSLPNYPSFYLQVAYTLLDSHLYHLSAPTTFFLSLSTVTASGTCSFTVSTLKLFIAFAAVPTSVFTHAEEQSEAQITGTYHDLLHFYFLTDNSFSDPNAECTTYTYAPVTQNIANIPTIWQARDDPPPERHCQPDALKCCEWYFL